MSKLSEPSKFGAKRASVRITDSEAKPFATARTSRNSTILQKSNTVRIGEKVTAGTLKRDNSIRSSKPLTSTYKTNTMQSKESKPDAVKSKPKAGAFLRRNTMNA
mgnify:CR=1 FL=1